MMIKKFSQFIPFLLLFLFITSEVIFAQGTRLLRQPDINSTHVVYTYGGDIWINSLNSSEAKRITSTPAVESNPHLSPDGKWIAENRGVVPDIKVRQDALSLSQNKDPQLEKAVQELLKLLLPTKKKVTYPSFSKPAKGQ